ncbi:MAG: FAD-dependent oxidoreductase [Sphaerobacter sp.]|nr:FAD-dependent oxidoreductase [Sphaerobacter sp.]MDI3341402.1 FAD-dependent oxidoreductase [Sphaerobacter sp.]
MAGPVVAIIGAGVVGAAVAFRLAAGGAQVHLVDAGQPGGGTSSASFAWVNGNQKTPRDYFDLNVAGLREHLRLRDELGAAPWLHPGGNLVWATDPVATDELAQRVRRLQAWGYAAEWRSAAQVTAELEPGIAFPRPDLSVAYFPDEFWVDAPLLVTRLVALAQERGAVVRAGTPAEAIETTQGRISAVRLADGSRLAVDAVVNASGAAADRVAGLLGLPLPLAPTTGLLVRVAVEGAPLRRIMHAPGVNLRPDGPGHVLLHSETIDPLLGERRTIAPDDPLCRELLQRARRVLPALAGARVVAARVGVRPIPADGRSCFGAVSAVPRYYEAVTHSGVTLSLLVGRLLARELLAGEVEPLAAPFRPDRFPRT